MEYAKVETGEDQEYNEYVLTIIMSSIDIKAVLPHNAKIHTKTKDIRYNRIVKERFRSTKQENQGKARHVRVAFTHSLSKFCIPTRLVFVYYLVEHNLADKSLLLAYEQY
jgi:hypothetical protein